MKATKSALAAAIGLLSLVAPRTVRADQYPYPDPNILGWGNSKGCQSLDGGGGTGMCMPGNVENPLSAISSWFQITNSAGDFTVANNTGSTVDTVSVTFSTTFLSTAGSLMVLQCNNESGGADLLCGTSTIPAIQVTGTGVSLSSTTPALLNGTQGLEAFFGTNGETITVTYTWEGSWNPVTDPSVDLQYASWNTTAAAISTPEPSAMALLGTGLLALMAMTWRRKRLA